MIMDSMVTFLRAFLDVKLCGVMAAVSMSRNVEYHDENWHAWTSDDVGLGSLGRDGSSSLDAMVEMGGMSGKEGMERMQTNLNKR